MRQVQPLHLPTKSACLEGKFAFALGWLPLKLVRKIQDPFVKLISYAHCRDQHKALDVEIRKNQLCSIHDTTGRCLRTLGGPLIVTDESTETNFLIGIYTFVVESEYYKL